MTFTPCIGVVLTPRFEELQISPCRLEELVHQIGPYRRSSPLASVIADVTRADEKVYRSRDAEQWQLYYRFLTIQL